MNMLEKYCVYQSTTMMDAIKIIQSNDCRCVIVLNEHQKVVGVFSEGDVLRAILVGTDTYTPLQNLIRPSFYSLKSRDINAARELIIDGITLIPIINEEHYLQDVITLRDIFGE